MSPNSLISYISKVVNKTRLLTTLEIRASQRRARHGDSLRARGPRLEIIFDRSATIRVSSLSHALSSAARVPRVTASLVLSVEHTCRVVIKTAQSVTEEQRLVIVFVLPSLPFLDYFLTFREHTRQSQSWCRLEIISARSRRYHGRSNDELGSLETSRLALLTLSVNFEQMES